MSRGNDDLPIQFHDAQQRYSSDLAGMWVFLSTEVLFFGGLFLVYAVYRHAYPGVFIEAGRELDKLLGSLNTGILIASSFAIAAAGYVAERGHIKTARWALLATALLGAVFLVIKGSEWAMEYHRHLVPFISRPFEYTGSHPEQAKLFFNLYFIMTGLHALHLLIGIGLVLAIFLLSLRETGHTFHRQAEVTALYWHFVDIVWVFLFPIFYLIR